MKKLALAVILLVWMLLSVIIDNALLLPKVSEVALRMFKQASEISFYSAILNSLLRMFMGLIIAALLGSILGIVAGINKKFEQFMLPIEMISQSVPNISYIILALIWLGQKKSVILIAFLVLYPLFYNQAKLSVKNLSVDLKNVMRIYNNDLWVRFKRVYLPNYYQYFVASFHQSISLGFKVCVMAEILGQVPDSLGLKLHLARVEIDTIGVFSYTIWIILLVLLMDVITKYFFKEK